MKCFSYFKAKPESPKPNSAPQLNQQNASDVSAAKRRISKSSSSLPSPRRTIPELYKEKQHKLRVFSLAELRVASNDFCRSLQIGQGGFGRVYKGTIVPANGKGEPLVVAIKKLNKHSLQGHKEWLAEVQFLGVVDHPNLVKLLGYCSVDGERGIQRLLVYEFMPNKSLEYYLFSRNLPSLSWRRRLQIILGAAQGLAYLHEGMETQVIYRDFKSSNILLDEELKPKLSDFGLAREGPTDDRTHVSTAVVGTYGYAAPEYVETGHLTIKSDLWSFGVVLYELLTGRRTLERNRPETEQRLLDWVREFPPDGQKFSMIVDPRLRDQYSLAAARRVGMLADRCLRKCPKDRPAMSEAVLVLKQALDDSSDGNSPRAKPESPGEFSGRHASRRGGAAAEAVKRRLAHGSQRHASSKGA